MAGLRSRARARGCILLAAIATLTACGGGDDGDTPPSGTPSPVPAPAPDAWAAVSAEVDAAHAAATAPGLALVVYAPDGTTLYSRVRGDFTLDRNIAVASASKMVSGVALLRLVDQGFLSLDSTTGAVLGWTGAEGTITLRHLLSFTSGLPTNFTAIGDGNCTTDATTTLAECVASIGAAGLRWPPGTRFEYGNTHLHVAARMAEVAVGTSWALIFAQQLRVPLGWPDTVAYYTAPRQAIGQTNPLIAGGLRITTSEYARLLGLVYSLGSYQGQRLLAADLVGAMGRDPYPAATTGFSPYAEFGLDREYGLTAWLECGTPAAGCEDFTSPGAFGFTPWIDRASGYYAIVAMESGSGGGVSQFSVELSLRLRPLIRAALAP